MRHLKLKKIDCSGGSYFEEEGRTYNEDKTDFLFDSTIAKIMNHPKNKMLQQKMIDDIIKLSAILKLCEDSGGVSLCRIWTYFYSSKCETNNKKNSSAMGVNHVHYKGYGHCMGCWNRLAESIISCISFQNYTDSVALPHFCYVFNLSKYREYNFEKFCDMDVKELEQILGPTSIQVKKASSALNLLQHLKENFFKDGKGTIPSNIDYYCDHFMFEKKTSLLILLSIYGYPFVTGLVNDVHVGRLVDRLGWLIPFKGKLQTASGKKVIISKDTMNSNYVTKIVELLLIDRPDLLSIINDVIGGIATSLSLKKQIDFCKVAAEHLGKEHQNILSKFRNKNKNNDDETRMKK